MESAESRTGCEVANDGKFRVRLPGDRPVLVRPWHPVLAPGAGGEGVLVDSERAPITLRLTASTLASFVARVPDPAVRAFVLTKGCTATLYEDEHLAKEVSRHEIAFTDDQGSFGGFKPGTYDICIRVRHFAPVILRKVGLGKDGNDLGIVEFTHGAQLTIENCKDRERRVRVAISVSNLGGPVYSESFGNLQAEWESVVFSGLGLGRFMVSLSYGKGEPAHVTKTIESDGKSPYTLSVDR